MREREVEVLRVQGDEVVVTSGLRAGEFVSLSDVPFFVEGMSVVSAEISGVESAP